MSQDMDTSDEAIHAIVVRARQTRASLPPELLRRILGRPAPAEARLVLWLALW